MYFSYSIVFCIQHDIGQLDGSAVCRQLGIQQWFHVSAKTGENVEEAFECLIKQVNSINSELSELIYSTTVFNSLVTGLCCYLYQFL